MQCVSVYKALLLLCAGGLTLQLGTSRNATLQPLHLLALVPYPDPLDSRTDAYAGSPAYSVVPAIRLAAQHINARPDMLSGYTLRILEGDSGCRAPALNSILNFTKHVFHSEYNVTAIVGPACSSPARTIGDFAVRRPSRLLSLLQMVSATAPVLSGERFANTFRSLTSTLAFVRAFSSLVEQRQWSRIATFYEAVRFFEDLHRRFEKEQDDLGRLVFSTTIFKEYLPVRELVRNQVRIAFLFASSDIIKRVLCLSYHQGLTYPAIQWLVPDKFPENILSNATFFNNGKRYSCSEDEMRKAARGVILLVFKLDRIDHSTNETVAGISFNRYKQEYWIENDKFIKEQPYIVDSVLKETPFSNVYYDAVWALGLAINYSLPLLGGYNLANYDYTQDNITQVIREQLFQVEFEGMSGFMKFNHSTRENIGIPIDILQIPVNLSSSNETQAVHIGYYLSTNKSIELEENAVFVDDEYEQSFEHLPVFVGSILIVFITLVLAITLALHLINSSLRRHKSVKATSTTLNHLIFSGCYLFLCAACIFVVFESFVVSQFEEITERVYIIYSVGCNVYYWGVFIGFTLIFGTVCMKAWRVYSLFSSFRRLHTFLIRDMSLVFYVLLLVLVDITILTAWNLDNPMLLHQERTFVERESTFHIELVCHIEQYSYMIALLVYKALQTLSVITFAVLTRHVHKQEFKTTKSTNALVYTLVLLVGLGALGYIAFIGQRLGQQLMIFIVLTVCVVLCDIFLFIPPIVPYFQTSSREKLTRLNSFLSTS